MTRTKSMLLGIGSADINKGQADATDQFAAFEIRLASVKAFIDDHYVVVSAFYESASEPGSSIARQKESAKKDTRWLRDLMKELEDTFSEHLLKLIDQKGKTDVETYKRVNLDRKLFSKIRNDKHYQPSKSTALALALSRSSQADLVIEYFITEGVFQIHQINEILFEFDQPLLGANR